jgi:hypothetical protein
MKILPFLKNLYKRRVDLNDEKSVFKKNVYSTPS